jgi:hypothetical protein
MSMSFALRERARPTLGVATSSPIERACPTDALPISLLDQRSNQAQEFLLLWSVASRDEKSSDFNVGDLST